ncbi:MAG: hypothetical protein JWM43_1017 [Acidobacteriaceae bacterium]|nr:hypothetical protein [Acidobacteriaceae bacterium]
MSSCVLPTTYRRTRLDCFRGGCFLAALSLAPFALRSAVAEDTARVRISTAAPQGSAPDANALLSQPPRSWAVEAAANELTALHHKDSYVRYRMHVRDEKGDQVRDVFESKDGTVARLILRDGRPLSTDEDKAERDRLKAMIDAPNDFLKHVRKEESGRKLADSMIRLLPDAMIFTYVPDQPQSGVNHGALEVVLDYQPDPKWKPPSTTAEALTGLKGRLWIDAKSKVLVRMEGTIFQGVNFGWGMLAHIYPGGKLVLEQTNTGGDRWIYTHFKQEVTVRALMVKTLNVRTNVDAEAFQVLAGPVPYQDAVRILLDTPLPTQ